MRSTLLLTTLVATLVPNLACGQATATEWARLLTSKETSDRIRAANELSKLGAGAARAANALARALADEVPRVRDAAADALGKIGRPALPIIKKALTDRDRYLGGLRAAGHLGKWADGLLPAITKFWYVERPETRVAVDNCLLAIGEPALPHLIGCLKDNAINCYVCELLRSMGPKAKPAVPALIKLLGKRGLLGSERAAEALGAIRDPQAVSGLLAAAEAGMTATDIRAAVAVKAVRSLGEIRADAGTVVPLLLRVLASERRDFVWILIQEQALNALESFDVRTPEVHAALCAFIAAASGKNKAQAMRLLNKLGG